jgi:hypothetical protein
MSSLNKLLKFLKAKNVADLLDEDKLKDISDEVIKGYEIDERSRKEWLEINREAMNIVKHCEGNRNNAQERNSIFEGQAKLVFPLLSQATIQLSARLIGHVVRNGQTVEMKVLGKDHPVVDQQSGQPLPGLYVKQEKARKASALMNYDLLVESNTWLKDMHKLLHIVSSWGVGFKQVYYDYINKRNCSEMIHPENIVINQNITSLEKAPRITVKHRLSKNEIIEYIRAEYFRDLELDELQVDPDDQETTDYEECQPTYLFLCQTCYLDLDDDGYAEPYKVYVHKESEQVFCIVPAFEYDDLSVNEKGEVLKISRRLDIVDYHAIDDPEGGFYSIGLNYLLLHPNKALTAIQRQLIDAGTLANAAAVSGFATTAFKTKARAIKMKLGEFPILDCNPNVDPNKQIIPMPFREPSAVLLQLFQLLIEINNKNGFISDILTGDVEMQNVPATTSLAMTEQATRAFRPMIEKLYISQKTEFKMLFHLYSKYLDNKKYVALHDDVLTVGSQDFDESSIDIVPVADPTMSSEAFKFGRQRALVEGMQVFGAVTNLQEAALRYYTDMGFQEPEKLIQQQQPQPDPKLIEVQLKGEIAKGQQQLDLMEIQLKTKDQEMKQLQLAMKSAQAQVKARESGAKIKKLEADAVMSYGQLENDQQRIPIEQQKADAMMIAAQNKGKSSE